MHNLSIDDIRFMTLHVGFCQHDGDWNWKNVRSPFARLYCVTEGEAQVIMPDGIKTLSKGHLYFIPAYTMHSDVCTSVFSHYYVHIYEDPNSRFSVFEELSLPFEVESEPIDEDLMRRLMAMNPQMGVPQSNPEAYDNHQSMLSNLQRSASRPLADKMESRGTLFLLMSRFLKTAKRRDNINDDRIRRSLTYIRHHIAENIDIGGLAEESFMSKDHFIRIFRKQTGMTPNVYVTKKKMECAELRLITTTTPIKMIAHQLGYADQSYFIKLFKKHTSLTPQHYREQYGL